MEEKEPKRALSSTKVKVILAVILLGVLAAGGYVGYLFWDYKENNPKFCVMCHLMTPAYNAWAESAHAGINCHECHHLSLMDQNRLLIVFVLKKPAAVPARHGKTIVPWKYCNSCHWEKHDDFPDAPKITGSRMHSKHYFDQQIECTICHGYIVHEFTPEPQFCVKCHQGKEVHGTGMEKLACLNCHTDRTVDLRPDRAKCLYCHGSEQMRKELVEAGTIDVRHYQPEQKLVRQATKIKLTSDAPMQFFCYQCHKPHEEKIRPGKDHCIKCHRNAPAAGKHPIHVQTMGMDCKECHRPHLWRVTPEQAKKDCVKCHAYKDPKLFLSMGEGAVATGEKLAKKNPCEEGTGRGPGYKAFDCP